MTDDEVAQARERAVVVLSGVEGRCSQAGPHLQLARDILALTDALRFANVLLDESIASEV